ncbi:unnamed protein product [Pleuronectes platessa]|uniref:Uncharacterized protein n=1 Tax=Pleuronectes platessa TaxID=8262 RepID=A0A9N7ZBT7_PLEPL|nr:unnamed protein product [Pleuronectes platessa]
MTSQRRSAKLQLRRSISEQLRDSTSRAWDLLWRNVRERRLAARVFVVDWDELQGGGGRAGGELTSSEGMSEAGIHEECSHKTSSGRAGGRPVAQRGLYCVPEAVDGSMEDVDAAVDVDSASASGHCGGADQASAAGDEGAEHSNLEGEEGAIAAATPKHENIADSGGDAVQSADTAAANCRRMERGDSVDQSAKDSESNDREGDGDSTNERACLEAMTPVCQDFYLRLGDTPRRRSALRLSRIIARQQLLRKLEQGAGEAARRNEHKELPLDGELGSSEWTCEWDGEETSVRAPERQIAACHHWHHEGFKLKTEAVLLPPLNFVHSVSAVPLPIAASAFKAMNETKIEAKEACDWLRAAGFPQYAQLYEDSQFPVDISSVKRDHDFWTGIWWSRYVDNPTFDPVASPPLRHALISHSKSRDPSGGRANGG